MHTIITHPDTWPFMLLAASGIMFSFIAVLVLFAQHAKLKNQFINYLSMQGFLKELLSGKDEYKEIREQLREHNSSKETAYMLCMWGFVGIVLTIVILAINQSL